MILEDTYNMLSWPATSYQNILQDFPRHLTYRGSYI